MAVTASLASFARGPGMSAYCATKTGVDAMCNSLRTEIAHHGVEVATIHPTWIGTDLVREADNESRRKRRICSPPFVVAAHRFRTLLTTRAFERDLLAVAPDMERRDRSRGKGRASERRP